MSERCRTDEHPAEATHSKAEAANSVRRDPEKKRRYTEVLLSTRTGSEDPAPEISFLVRLLKVVQLQVRNTRFILKLYTHMHTYCSCFQYRID